MTVPASLAAEPPPPAVLPPWQERLPPQWRSPGWNRQALMLWAVVAAVTFFGGSAVEQVGLPAPHLITGLVVGLVIALTGLIRRTGAVLPKIVYLAGQAIAGVLLGTYFSLPALGRTGWALVPLVAVTLLTLLLSVAAGLVLARRTDLDEPTAALGMIAGGSAGIVAAADDLHADARLVAVLQYVRLVLVVLTAPLLVRFVLAPHGTYATVGAKEIEAVVSLHSFILTPLLALGGAWAAIRLRVPAGALIGPLVLTAIGGGLGLWNDLQPPEVVREPAFIVIGLAVGVGFDLLVIRRAAKAAPAALAAIVIIVLACGGLAALIAASTHISLLDAYLATTPGGINAVLVTAFAAGANCLVFGIQGLRLFVMVLAAPVLIRWLLRRHDQHRQQSAPRGGARKL